MNTKGTVFSMALALAGLLLAVEARAGAGYARNAFSEGSSGSGKAKKAEPIHAGVARNADSGGEKNPACKPNPDKGLAADLDKSCGGLKGGGLNCGEFNCGKGLKTVSSAGKDGKDYGGFGCGRRECWDRGCCVGRRPYCICFQPSFYAPCCNAGCEDLVLDDPSCSVALDVAAIPVPAVKTVRIVNPVETQTTFAFTINGQAYSLGAGKTQELEVTRDMVIKFDRKP